MMDSLVGLPSCQGAMNRIFRPIGWNALGLHLETIS
jgi:hypothetical protein